MDIKEDNDSMSFKDYQINPTLNIFENFDSSLNSKSNPFIKESKKFTERNQNLKSKILENKENETKPIVNDKNNVIEDKKENKFNGKH